MSFRLPLLVVMGLAILWLAYVGGTQAPNNLALKQVNSFHFEPEQQLNPRPMNQGAAATPSYSQRSGVEYSVSPTAEAPKGAATTSVEHGESMDPGDSSLWPSFDDSSIVSTGTDLDPGDSSFWPRFDSTEVVVHGSPEDPEKDGDWISTDANIAVDGLQMDPEESSRWPLSDQTDVIVRGEALDPDDF